MISINERHTISIVNAVLDLMCLAQVFNMFGVHAKVHVY